MKWLNQRGDTLVEITIAMAILAMVLSSCVLLGTSAMRVGNDARLRTQASEFAQAQAEGLHNYRDKATWSTFTSNPVILAGDSGTAFHMDSSSGSWAPTSGSFKPTINGSNSPFSVSVTSKLLSASERSFYISVSWLSPGGQANSTQFTSYLVDPNAATGYVAPTAIYHVEGESFGLGWCAAYASDPSASGGRYLDICSGDDLPSPPGKGVAVQDQTINFTSATSSIIVRAVEFPDIGAPGAANFTIWIDGSPVFSGSVSSTSFQTFVHSANISAGSHRVHVTFDNDSCTACLQPPGTPGVGDRNLGIDFVEFN